MKKIKYAVLVVFFCLSTIAMGEDYNFSERMLKDITIMEGRHFKNKADPADSSEYRLERLEIELMGKTFEEKSLDERMKRVRIASQKRFFEGVAMPSSIKMSSTKFDNDSIEVVKKNDVGIIDGLMRLYAPQVYNFYRERSERLMRYER